MLFESNRIPIQKSRLHKIQSTLTMKHKIQTQMLIHPSKYKIQTEGAFGWGDLKYSEDDGKTYQVELFDTKEEAGEELKNILSEFNEDEEMYRVVSEDVLEDFNIYSE